MTLIEVRSLKPGKKIYIKETNEPVIVRRRPERNDGEEMYYIYISPLDDPDNISKLGHKWLSLKPMESKGKNKKRRNY